MARRYDIIGVTDVTGSGFSTQAVSVTDTATKIPTTNLANRKAISVRNLDNSNRVYLGGAGVTTSTGFPILPFESLPFAMSSGAQLYGICDTGVTVSCRIIEIDNG